MKYLVLVFISAMLLASCTSSNRITYLNSVSPDSLKPWKLDLAAYEQKYSKYDGVFLNSEYTMEHFGGKSDWGFVKVRKLRFLVLNPDAEWLSTFRFDEDPGEELREVYIHMTLPDGTVHAYGANDLKVEKSGKNTRLYKFAYPNIQKGAIIEEGYVAEVTNKYEDLNQDISLQYSVPCEHLSVRFAYPDWWRTRVKQLGPDTRLDYKEIRDEENRKVILSYEENDVPAIAHEPYAPFFKESGKYLEVMVTFLEMSERYTSYLSWSQLARGFAQFAVDKESFWSGRLENQVEELTKDLTTDAEKIDAIVSYVQKNIKVGRSESDDNFADVLKKQEGNIYLVNGLTRAMLDEAKIRAELLLIHDARDGYFDESYISPDQFYIPAVAAITDDQTYVLFPYAKNLPIDLIPDHFQGQRALRVSAGGFEGFMNIPEGNATDNIVDDNYVLDIDEEGRINVTEEKILRGINAYTMREALAAVKPEEMEKEMKSLLTYDEGDVSIAKYDIENQDDYHKPLIIRLNYTIDNLVTITPEEVLFQTGGLFSQSTVSKYKVDTDERQLPIRIYSDERLNKTITIKHPQNWSLTTELPKVDYQNMFGSISGKYEVTDSELKISQMRTLKKASEPKEKADDLLAVTGRRSRLYIPTLVFRVEEQP